jgi:uncharacterized protein involved in outer membrane biogenesis
MRIILKSLLAIVVVLVVVVAGALLYLVNMDPNNHKDRITAMVAEQTGLTLHLDGDIGLTFYPWFGISVENVTVDNPPGYGDTHLLRLDSAQLRFMLLPALRGRYEIDTIRLHGADINLIVNEQGRGNWEGLIDEAETEPPSSVEPGDMGLANVRLGGVDIRNGRLGFDDRQNGQQYEIRNFNASTGELIYGEPIALELALDAISSQPQLEASTRLEGTIAYSDDGQRFDIAPLRLDMTLSGPNVPDGSADVRLATNVHVDLAADTLNITALELDGPGLSLLAEISGRQIQGSSPQFDTELTLNGDDLGLLFRIAEMDELAERIASLDSPGYDISTALSISPATGGVDLTRLEASLLGASIDGRLSASGMDGDNAQINGVLNANGPDLPLLLQVAGRFLGNDSPLTLYGEQLASLSQRGFQLETEFDVDLAQGNINLPQLRADALGLRLDGRLTASDFNNNGPISGNLQLRGEQLPPLLRAIDQGDLADSLRSINLETEVSGRQDDLVISPLRLALRLEGPAVTGGPQTINISASSRMNLDQERLEVERLEISGAGLDVQGNVLVNRFIEAPAFEGQLQVATFNLRQLLQQLGQEAPDTPDSNALTSVGLQADFSGDLDSISSQTLTLILDETTVNGNLSVQNFEQPRVRFNIEIDRIDADRYLPEPATEAEVAAAEEEVELPVDLLRALDVEGSLAIADLRILGLRLANLAASVDAGDGTLALSPMSMDLYQGRYEGELALNVQNDMPALRFNTSLESVALQPLMIDLVDATFLSGIGTISLALESSGPTVSSLIRNLDGSGDMVVNDGVLRGVNIGGTLAQIETMIRSQRVASLDRGEETRFEQFSATLNIAQGAIRSNDLEILAPGFRVTGSGLLADLGEDRINFNLTAAVDRSTATVGEQEYDIGGHSLPIACTGSMSAPRCLPDFEAVVRQALGGAIERRLGDFLQRQLGN